ncbi:MAG: helix-turn-helix domain-containing protein [Leptospirales bacterium]|nr:helix-turn-helix domain-containing protein [Leptospirales bacterium]
MKQEKGSMVHFADKVKALREKQGLSQAELAEKAGINPTALSRILGGERDLKPSHARSLADTLGVTVMELLHQTEHSEVFAGWVPTEELTVSQQVIDRQATELDSLKIQLEGAKAENASLNTQLSQLFKRLEGADMENATLKGQIANFESIRTELNQARQAIAGLTGEKERLTSQLERLTVSHQQTSSQLQAHKSLIHQWQIRANQLNNDLIAARSNVAPAAILSALAGFGIAKMLEEDR